MHIICDTLYDIYYILIITILGKVGRNEPGWFQEASNILEPLIERRNTTFAAHTSNPSRRSLIRTLKTTRREIKKAVALAKEKWILSLWDHLNWGCIEKGGTSGIWTSINRIRASLSKVQKPKQTQMKNPMEQNARHLRKMRKSSATTLHNSTKNNPRIVIQSTHSWINSQFVLRWMNFQRTKR